MFLPRQNVLRDVKAEFVDGCLGKSCRGGEDGICAACGRNAFDGLEMVKSFAR